MKVARRAGREDVDDQGVALVRRVGERDRRRIGPSVVTAGQAGRSDASEPESPGGDLWMLAAFANRIGYNLRIAQEASFAAFSLGARSAEFRPGWYTVMSVMSDNPGLAPSELSRLCGRDRSTLTTTLKALHARGLIERHPNAQDHRSYSVRLTRAGEAMVDELRLIARAHDDRLDALVGPDKPVFLAVLRRIAERMGAAAND